MSNRVANTVMLPVEEYEALKSEAADAASLRKKYADAMMRLEHYENPRVEGVVAQSSSSQDEHGPEPVDLPMEPK
jgi:hypothetical protein